MGRPRSRPLRNDQLLSTHKVETWYLSALVALSFFDSLWFPFSRGQLIHTADRSTGSLIEQEDVEPEVLPHDVGENANQKRVHFDQAPPLRPDGMGLRRTSMEY